jgi:hypothetical protein
MNWKKRLTHSKATHIHKKKVLEELRSAVAKAREAGDDAAIRAFTRLLEMAQGEHVN